MNPTSSSMAERGRWAVAGVFLVNGFLVGSWAPQIPVLASRFQIQEFTLGLLILLFGGGALAAMPCCGVLIARFGSRVVARSFACFAVFGLLAVAAAPNLMLAGLALFVFGALSGGMDVAMNANAVTVERRLKRAVMSSSHGFWSLGGFAGGGLGGLVIGSYGHLLHAGLVTVLALVAIGFVLPNLIGGDQAARSEGKRRLSLPRAPLVYLTGLIALFSMVPEGAVLDWGALYLKQERGASISTAALAFSAFSATMALMRFAGDHVRNRLGAVTTLRLSSLIAAVGLLGAGLASSPASAIAAFALCGVGTANMVPIAFSAAGNQPGLAPGVGMSVATSIGYAGLLLAPSFIGFVAGKTGFSPVFIALAAILALVSAMAGLARAADGA